MGDESQHRLSTGYLLQEYRIDDILGEGGFGITYLATDANLGFAVAIKEYFPFDQAVRNADLSVTARSRESQEMFDWGLERFLEEANRLAQFRGHPNIVRVNRVIRENATAYFVMEYEEGESLHDIIEREAPMEEGRLQYLIGAVLDGLAEVHSREILHRDIKPDNIFVREDGVPVLLDFGSARRDQRSRALTGIVAEGYSPLEQYASDSANQGVWSDIYAAAATIYHAISGAPPPPSPRRRLKDTMIPAAEVAAGMYNADFLEAVDWALGIAPTDRPTDVETWRAALFPDLGDDAEDGGEDDEEDDDDDDDEGYEEEDDTDDDEDAPYALSDEEYAALQAGADAGDADAQYNLAEAHEYGWIDDASESLAAHYYRLAAEQEHMEAQNSMGDCYQYGTGVPESEEEAASWYRRAAHAGHDGAQYEIGYMYQMGQGVAQQNGGTAANYFRKSADQGNNLATHSLGELYEQGNGVDQDLSHAVSLYRQVADADLSFGQYDLARMLEHGLGTPADLDEALDWYSRAADKDNSSAQYALGRLYYEGDKIPFDLDASIAWLRLAAENNSFEAQQRLDEYEAGDLINFDGDEDIPPFEPDLDPESEIPLSPGEQQRASIIGFLETVFGFIWFKLPEWTVMLGWRWAYYGLAAYCLRYAVAGGFYMFGDAGWNPVALLEYSGDDGWLSRLYWFCTLSTDELLGGLAPDFYFQWAAAFEAWTGWDNTVAPAFDYLHMGFGLWLVALVWVIAWGIVLLPLSMAADAISPPDRR